MKKKLGWIVIAVGTLAITTFVVTRLLVTDEMRVSRVVKSLARHLNARDAGSFCLLLTDDYRDEQVGDRAAMRQLVSQGAGYFDEVSITVRELQVEVDGEEGEADFLADCSARGRGRKNAWRWRTPVHVYLRKSDGEWRIYLAEYGLPNRIR